MRMRLLAIVSAMLVAIVAFPFAATAQSSNVARISATSYLDSSSGINLCNTEIEIEAVVLYNGNGPVLGGTGTGDVRIIANTSYFEINGTLEVGGETVSIYGGGVVFCLLPGLAMVYGDFFIYADEQMMPVAQPLQVGDDDTVCGGMVGTLQDGTHPRQGRVSLTLTGAATDECISIS